MFMGGWSRGETLTAVRVELQDDRITNDPHRALDIDLDTPLDASQLVLPTPTHRVTKSLTGEPCLATPNRPEIVGGAGNGLGKGAWRFFPAYSGRAGSGVFTRHGGAHAAEEAAVMERQRARESRKESKRKTKEGADEKGKKKKSKKKKSKPEGEEGAEGNLETATQVLAVEGADAAVGAASATEAAPGAGAEGVSAVAASGGESSSTQALPLAPSHTHVGGGCAADAGATSAGKKKKTKVCLPSVVCAAPAVSQNLRWVVTVARIVWFATSPAEGCHSNQEEEEGGQGSPCGEHGG